MSPLPFALKVALALVVAAAAAYDCKYRRIPNWLTLSGLVLGFGLNVLLGGISGSFVAGEGVLLAFAIYFPLYLMKGMGAGDVKLMAAVASIAGPFGWFEIFVATSLVGGLAAALLALKKRRLGETCWNMLGIVHDLSQLRPPYRSNAQLDIRHPDALRMPHGLTIAIGSMAFLLFASASIVRVLP